MWIFVRFIISLVLDLLEKELSDEALAQFIKARKKLGLKLSKKELQQNILNQIKNAFGFNKVSRLIKIAKNFPEELEKKVRQLKPQELTKLQNIIKKIQRKQSPFADKTEHKENYEFALLSSSWIIDGAYVPSSKTSGILTLDFLGAKHSYTYFNVPKRVWENMKEAKGRNGTGAGSVFWNQFLRGNNGWKMYNRIEYNLATNLSKSKTTPITELKIYNQLVKKYRQKTIRFYKGIRERVAILKTREKIYRTKQNKLLRKMRGK